MKGALETECTTWMYSARLNCTSANDLRWQSFEYFATVKKKSLMYTLNSIFSKLCYVPVLPISVNGTFILLVAQARSRGILLVITSMSSFTSKIYTLCIAGLENELYHETIYSSVALLTPIRSKPLLLLLWSTAGFLPHFSAFLVTLQSTLRV